jgi:hypothetical protein
MGLFPTWILIVLVASAVCTALAVLLSRLWSLHTSDDLRVRMASKKTNELAASEAMLIVAQALTRAWLVEHPSLGIEISLRIWLIPTALLSLYMLFGVVMSKKVDDMNGS